MTPLPVVYSCSGCSSAAQMSNQIALWLDRENIAEMSCIAGVGGDVKSLVFKAIKAESIIGIDGCPLHCVKSVLARHNVNCDLHFDLSNYDVEKRRHQDFDPDKAKIVFEDISRKILSKKIK